VEEIAIGREYGAVCAEWCVGDLSLEMRRVVRQGTAC